MSNIPLSADRKKPRPLKRPLGEYRMEISTQIDRKRNVRIHRLIGPTSVPELEKISAGFYKSPDYDLGMNALWDLKDADFSSVTSSDIDSIVGLAKKLWGQGGKRKVALVVTKELDYGLSRMYEILMSEVTSDNIMVFKDYDKAEKWLGE